ncbi:MAG: hypothetical protein Q9217_004319 [Psora testacea]
MDFKKLKGKAAVALPPRSPPKPLNPPDLPKADRDLIDYWPDSERKKSAKQRETEGGTMNSMDALMHNPIGLPSDKAKRYAARNRIYKEGRNKEKLTASKEGYGITYEHSTEGEVIAKQKKLNVALSRVKNEGHNEKVLKELEDAYTAYNRGKTECWDLVSLEDIKARGTYRQGHQNQSRHEQQGEKARRNDTGLLVGEYGFAGQNLLGVGWRPVNTIRCNVTQLYYLTLPRMLRETQGKTNALKDIYEYNFVLIFDAMDIQTCISSVVAEDSLSDQKKYIDFTIYVQATYGIQVEYFEPEKLEDWLSDFLLEVRKTILGTIPGVPPVTAFAEFIVAFVPKEPEWIDDPKNIAPLAINRAVGSQKEIREGLKMATKFMKTAFRNRRFGEGSGTRGMEIGFRFRDIRHAMVRLASLRIDFSTGDNQGRLARRIV